LAGLSIPVTLAAFGGLAPSYLSESKPPLPTMAKWLSLRDALLNSKPSVSCLRSDFIDSVFTWIRDLQPRSSAPDEDALEEKVLSDLKNLLPLRDQVIEWILLEGRMGQDSTLSPMVMDFLERLLTMKYRPDDMQSWNDWWFESSGILVLELFLYTVASLVKLGKAPVLRDVLSGNYLRPEARLGGEPFTRFSDFYTYSQVLERRKDRLTVCAFLSPPSLDRCNHSNSISVGTFWNEHRPGCVPRTEDKPLRKGPKRFWQIMIPPWLKSAG
jgi:hypothetical protein